MTWLAALLLTAALLTQPMPPKRPNQPVPVQLTDAEANARTLLRGALGGSQERKAVLQITGAIGRVPLRAGDGALWRDATTTEHLVVYVRQGRQSGDTKFERFKTSRTDDPDSLRVVDNLGNVLVPVQDTIPSKWALGASRSPMPTDDPDHPAVDAYVFAAPPVGAQRVELRFPKQTRDPYTMVVADLRRAGAEDRNYPASNSLVTRGPVQVSVDSAVWATRTIRRNNGRQTSGVLTLAITVKNLSIQDSPRLAALGANQCTVVVGKQTAAAVDAVGAPKSDSSRVLRPKQSHTTFLNVECAHPSAGTALTITVNNGWAGLPQNIELKVPASHIWWGE